MNKQREDYPLTLTVKEVSEIMRISLSKAYTIVKRPDFPVIVDGNRFIIPRDTFFRWMEQAASANFAKRPS